MEVALNTVEDSALTQILTVLHLKRGHAEINSAVPVGQNGKFKSKQNYWSFNDFLGVNGKSAEVRYFYMKIKGRNLL